MSLTFWQHNLEMQQCLKKKKEKRNYDTRFEKYDKFIMLFCHFFQIQSENENMMTLQH